MIRIRAAITVLAVLAALSTAAAAEDASMPRSSWEAAGRYVLAARAIGCLDIAMSMVYRSAERLVLGGSGECAWLKGGEKVMVRTAKEVHGTTWLCARMTVPDDFELWDLSPNAPPLPRHPLIPCYWLPKSDLSNVGWKP